MKYQTIILILSDGRKIYAVVPAFCEEKALPVSVARILITEPKELPPDCSFGPLKNILDEPG